MISGRLLFAVLIVLTAWFLLLCIVFRKATRSDSANGISLVGLGSATVAVASLLALHATWISPNVSQRLNLARATPVRLWKRKAEVCRSGQRRFYRLSLGVPGRVSGDFDGSASSQTPDSPSHP